MKSILVGIDGSVRGDKALEWACRLAARRGCALALIAVVSPEVERVAATKEMVNAAVSNALGAAQHYVEEHYPELAVSASSTSGDIVEALVSASEEHDMVVMGTHRTSTIGEKVWGAKGLRVSVATTVPTAIIPADWSEEREGKGIMVGIGPDDVSTAAADMGVDLACVTGQPVRLVSAWGVPALLARPAKALGGGLAPVGDDFQRELDRRVAAYRAAHPDLDIVGEAIEGPSPTQVLLDEAEGESLLILGTHARSMVGRALFGSVSYGCLARLTVPTVVVPSK